MNTIEVRRAANLLAKLASQQETLDRLRGCTSVMGLHGVQLEREFTPSASNKFPPIMPMKGIAEALGVTERRIGEAFVQTLIHFAAENVGRTRARLKELGVTPAGANDERNAA